MYSVFDLPPPTSHPAFCRVFAPNALSVGLMCPIESYAGDVPSMASHIELAQEAEALGFAALWLRDVPLRDPSFGDVGQAFEIFTHLGYLAGATRSIALGTAAVILPLRHPLHIAKAAASVDQLSGGRMILGVASGDRPAEFPAFGVDAEMRGALFRESLRVVQEALSTDFPSIRSPFGTVNGADLVPKAKTRGLPVLVTGHSQQPLDWIARNADGWMTYPRAPALQAAKVAQWQAVAQDARPGTFMPFMQSLYIDLDSDADGPPIPIHLGFRCGRVSLLRMLHSLRDAGVNHVALNLKYGHRPAPMVMREVAEHVLPRLGDSY